MPGLYSILSKCGKVDILQTEHQFERKQLAYPAGTLEHLDKSTMAEHSITWGTATSSITPASCLANWYMEHIIKETIVI
jgi:hypothetical protein